MPAFQTYPIQHIPYCLSVPEEMHKLKVATRTAAITATLYKLLFIKTESQSTLPNMSLLLLYPP